MTAVASEGSGRTCADERLEVVMAVEFINNWLASQE
jgi:hypothetical protein